MSETDTTQTSAAAPVVTNFKEATDYVRSHLSAKNFTGQPMVAAFTRDQKALYVGTAKAGHPMGPLIDDHIFPIPGRVYVIYDAATESSDLPLGVKFTDEDPSDDAVKLHKFYAYADVVQASTDGVQYLHDGTLPANTQT